MDTGSQRPVTNIKGFEVGVEGAAPVVPSTPGDFVECEVRVPSGIMDAAGRQIPSAEVRTVRGTYVGLVPYPHRFQIAVHQGTGICRVILSQGPGFWVPELQRVIWEGEVVRWRTLPRATLTSVDGGEA